MDLTQYYNNVFFENASLPSYHQYQSSNIYNQSCYDNTSTATCLVSPDSAISSPPCSPDMMQNGQNMYDNFINYENTQNSYNPNEYNQGQMSPMVQQTVISTAELNYYQSSMTPTFVTSNQASPAFSNVSPANTSSFEWGINSSNSESDKENSPPTKQNFLNVNTKTSQAMPSPQCSPSPRSTSSKTPKIPPLEILQARRIAANMRERKRMNKINSAFCRLKRVLPGLDKNKDLSKFESLLLAQDYIRRLATMLEYDLQ